MQVHYNLLVGDKPVKNSLVLHTVPTSTPLLPLKLDLDVRPAGHPLPGRRDRPALQPGGLARQPGTAFRRERGRLRERHRAGRAAATRRILRRETRPSCTWPITNGGYIVRVQAHMHLLGQQLHDGPQPRDTAGEDHPRRPRLQLPLPEGLQPEHADRGDVRREGAGHLYLRPDLAQELPILRKAPPHFVTWGDGSSDEMCLGLTWTSSTIPNSHNPV